jgi:hypothetical protein
MIESPELPFIDADVRHVVVRVNPYGRYVLDAFTDKEPWQQHTLPISYVTQEKAFDVAIALRARIRPVRRIMGRSVESLPL